MLAVSHAARLVATGHRDRPDGGFIAGLLFIHRDLDEGNARTVRRDLRIADPVELENVFLSDGTLLPLGKSDDCGTNDQSRDEETSSTVHEGSLMETDCYSTLGKVGLEDSGRPLNVS